MDLLTRHTSCRSREDGGRTVVGARQPAWPRPGDLPRPPAAGGESGSRSRICTIAPASTAAGRAEDLLHSIDVPNVIRANLRVLDTVRARLVPALRPRLSV
ncbi:hypothetical protein AB1484_29060, partial [Parafrankia sp. FMc6]|uniref:hypothetical protein n=1 Tax=Parafrankia soli TaxID=2599596 RepID=UPI0034D5B257